MAVSSYPPISTGPTPPRVFGGAGRFTNLALPAGTTSIQSPAGGRLGNTVFGPGVAVVTSSTPINELILHAKAEFTANSARSGFNWGNNTSYRDPALLQRSVCYDVGRTRAFGISNGTNNSAGDHTWQYRFDANGDGNLWYNGSAQYGPIEMMAKTTTGTVWGRRNSASFWVNGNVSELGSATAYTFASGNNGTVNIRDVASTQVNGDFIAVGNSKNMWRGTAGPTPSAVNFMDSTHFSQFSGSWTRVVAKTGASGYYFVTGANNGSIRSTGPSPTTPADFTVVTNPINASGTTVNNTAYNEDTNTWLIINGTSAAVSTNDLVTWTSVTLPFNGDSGVYAAGGYFFKVADSRNAFVSRNGISWSRLIIHVESGMETLYPTIDAVAATRQPDGTYRFFALGVTSSAFVDSQGFYGHATWSEFEFSPPAAIVTSHAGIELGVA